MRYIGRPEKRPNPIDYCEPMRERNKFPSLTRSCKPWIAAISLALLAMLPTGSVNFARAEIASSETLQSNSNKSRELLLTRLEFDQLGLRMIGMSRFMGRDSVYIRHPGSRDSMIYEVGSVIAGFEIISIQPQYTIFERNGFQFWLAVSSGSEPALPPQGRTHSAPSEPVEIKSASPETKTLTKAYETAAVIGFTPTKDDGEIDFIVPIRGELTSGFGYRKSPMGGGRSYHRGVDIAAPNKTPVLAAESGRVTKVSRSWAKGLNIEIDHGQGFSTAYFHLARASVSEGQRVHQGEVIGLEGSTGRSTGPHLHFEILKNGRAVDPALYLPELR